MELIIEEVSRGHKLLGRHKFSQQSVSIGRGYNNDIILDDPHICPDHLSIDFDGNNWVVTDENSINGSYLGDGKKSADQHVINSGDVISFGKSQIRVLFPNHPVAESVKFSPFESFVDIARKPASLISNVILFSIIAGFVFYLNKPIEITFGQLLAPIIQMVLLFSLWPCLVALISHLTKHEARVMSQLGISFIFFNLMWSYDLVENIVRFNLSSNWPTGLLTMIIPILLAFSMFWLNCYIGFHMSKRRKIIVASALTLLLFGGSMLVKLSSKPEFDPRPHYDATIMSPSFVLRKGVSPEQFIEDSAHLYKKTQKQSEKDKR